MADEEKKDNSPKIEKDSPPNKSVNVTKPKYTPPPMSNIDASKVSDHTLKEQQSLERLKKKIGTIEHKESKASKIKSIVAIILAILLIIIVVVFILLLSQNKAEPEDTSSIRVSMEIENKSVLSVISEEGFEELRPIWPGDKLPISAYARNSNEYGGDDHTSEVVPPNVYVRFRIRFILDYEDRYDIIIPTMTSNWTKYNPEAEAQINNGVTEDDHFYYYCGSLAFSRRIELFSELEFDGNKIFIEDAGKYGQIQVTVESVEANTNYLLDGIWPTAPKRWVLDMVAGKYNTNA